jgi:hypothetical protein
MKNLREMGHKVDDIEIKKLRNNDDNESVADSIIEKM